MATTKSKLESNIRAYHKLLGEMCNQVWGQKISNETILNLFYLPRDTFLDFCKGNKLNYSTIAGTIQEWVLFHLVKTGVARYSKKRDNVEVINRCRIPFIWKKGKGRQKQINLDVAVRDKNSKKLYYAFEIKTNFEDGFEKYREEERGVFHHRRKVFPPFRYFYISLTPPPKGIIKKYKRDLNTLQRRKELYILSPDTRGLPGPIKLIECLKKLLKEIK